jgi:hypothetical protein
MKKLTIFFGTLLLLLAPTQADQDLWESKGPHVRIKRNSFDGSYVEFERSPDDRKLKKVTKDKDDNVMMTAVYYRNPKGFLTLGEIYDGQGTQLFRVRYGYDKNTGYLVAEDMFDSRVKFQRPDPNGQMKEFPVRRIYYWYDDEGNQSKAIALVPKKGKRAEEVFKRKDWKENDLYNQEKFDPNNSTAPEDPFEKGKKK